MLYREIMAVCSEIHTKHINTLCGQNVELLNVKLAVHIVTTGLYCRFRAFQTDSAIKNNTLKRLNKFSCTMYRRNAVGIVKVFLSTQDTQFTIT